MHSWQMQEAKARLSELVKRAQAEGPQDITHHGRSVAVVLSRAAYAQLAGQDASLVEFMRASPLAQLDDDFEFERNPDANRDIAL